MQTGFPQQIKQLSARLGRSDILDCHFDPQVRPPRPPALAVDALVHGENPAEGQTASPRSILRQHSRSKRIARSAEER